MTRLLVALAVAAAVALIVWLLSNPVTVAPRSVDPEPMPVTVPVEVRVATQHVEAEQVTAEAAESMREWRRLRADTRPR